MKIIVISDSHGAEFYIKKVLDMHRDADAAIFLGDGVRDFFSLREKYGTLAFIGVGLEVYDPQKTEGYVLTVEELEPVGRLLIVNF